MAFVSASRRAWYRLRHRGSRFVPRVETAQANEAGHERSLDRDHTTGLCASNHHFIRQAVEQMERREAAVEKAGPIDDAGVVVAKGGTEAAVAVLLAQPPVPR